MRTYTALLLSTLICNLLSISAQPLSNDDFIRESLINTAEHFQKTGQIGLDLSLHDTLNGTLPGQRWPRTLNIFTYVLPLEQKILFNFQPIIYDKYEVPERYFISGMAGFDGQVIWTADTFGYWDYTLVPASYHPLNRYFPGIAQYDLHIKPYQNFLFSPSGQKFYMDADAYSTGYNTDRHVQVTAHYPLNNAAGQYRVRYLDRDKNYQWEKYFDTKKPYVLGVAHKGQSVLIATDEGPGSLISCMDSSGQELWTSPWKGSKNESIVTSTFSTFLRYDPSNGRVAITGPELSDTLAMFSKGDYSTTNELPYRILAVPGKDMYCLFTMEGIKQFRIAIIDEQQQMDARNLISWHLTDAFYHFRVYFDENTNSLKVYFDRELVLEKKGGHDGTNTSGTKKGD